MRWMGLLLCVCLLAGCSGMELNERGFILGAALDLGADGRIVLTSQFYKPSPSGRGTFVNIRTEGMTVADAIRDITDNLGRKAQWSHMQALLIGETMARSGRWSEVFDHFYRDDEPRLTTRVVITEGSAGRYLSFKPYIETSFSRQSREAQRSSAAYSGKTVETNLLDLRRMLSSQTETAVVPYMKIKENVSTPKPYVNGAAVIRGHRMVSLLQPRDVQSYLMLTGQFREGILVVPCEAAGKGDSFEMVQQDRSMSVKLRDGVPHVRVKLRITGTVRELVCTSLSTPEAVKAYQRKIAGAVGDQLTRSLRSFQRANADVLGIGNELYKKYPREWKRLRKDWSEEYGRTAFAFDIRVVISNTGLENGHSVFVKGG